LSAIDSSDPEVATTAAQLNDRDLVEYEYRSFDRHFLIRDERLADRIRPVLWRTHSSDQIYITTLLTEPLGEGPAATIAVESPPDLHYFCGRGGKDILPLYRYASRTHPNITHGLLDQLAEHLGREVTPESFVAYLLGVLGTGAFTELFADELSSAGPRVPLTAEPDLFDGAVAIGQRLGYLQSRGTRFARPNWELPRGTAQIETAIPSAVADCPREAVYDPSTQTLRIGTGQVCPVAPEVWDFRISGYDPVKAWVTRRLADPYIAGSSALDEIRPIAWDFAMQSELLQVIAIVEEIVTDLTPRAAALLGLISAGKAINAVELLKPTGEQRRPPTVRVENQDGLL
jgi:hypothetical protein